jgi:hypothetical protein
VSQLRAESLNFFVRDASGSCIPVVEICNNTAAHAIDDGSERSIYCRE